MLSVTIISATPTNSTLLSASSAVQHDLDLPPDRNRAKRLDIIFAWTIPVLTMPP